MIISITEGLLSKTDFPLLVSIFEKLSRLFLTPLELHLLEDSTRYWGRCSWKRVHKNFYKGFLGKGEWLTLLSIHYPEFTKFKHLRI